LFFLDILKVRLYLPFFLPFIQISGKEFIRRII